MSGSRAYVKQGGTAEEFLKPSSTTWLIFLIPNYISEGKNQLVIAVGCTGGRHRSVTIARELYAHLRERERVRDPAGAQGHRPLRTGGTGGGKRCLFQPG